MKRTTKPQQPELPPTASWGGRRKGAGRKPNPNSGEPHRARPIHNPAHPVHATLRTREDVRGLRTARVFDLLMQSIKEASDAEFRVVHFSVQPDHIHVIVEAHDTESLSRGMRGLSIRLARAVNRALARRGPVWKDRYHARALTRAREVRDALLEGFANHRKHGESPGSLEPVQPAQTSLAREGWRRHRLLGV